MTNFMEPSNANVTHRPSFTKHLFQVSTQDYFINLQLLSIPNAIFDMMSVEYNATVSLMLASVVFENLFTKLSVIPDMIPNIDFIFPELNVCEIFIRFGFQSSTFMVSCG